MAWIAQEEKRSVASKINPILKKYGLKGTLSIFHHSKLVLKISSGPIDFIKNLNTVAGKRDFGRFEPITCGYMNINEYHYKDYFSGIALEALKEIIPAMYTDDYHDNSDISSDYFDVSYYISVHIGTWDKPYRVI